MYAGLDWAGKGWFAVVYNGEQWDAGFYPTILNFWHATDVDRALIDIPIGLTASDPRACDDVAATYLDDQSSKVFDTPVSEAVFAQNIDAAKAVHEERDVGFSITNQAWGIVPRIREADVFLQQHPEASDVLLESHPEVCFAALNGGDALASDKREEAGREERLELLADDFPDPHAFLSEIESVFMEPSYAPVVGKSSRDDVVDAMVLAAAAREGDLVSMPSDPDHDETLDRQIRIVRPQERDATGD